ncbi:TIGR03279 family radical SAM protein [Acaryochloris sp. 'Moss Beach']|uniref:TIGR03279 family radical SAM protein n=1 Tax=Acaryochloris sp. 'Moss Beach' TaxID=2740837 RepID=UPI001F3C32D2|nr:TIGR03279 family radical SAM protein [Acaryochloris sp. 'Moss Beach']UJB69329.1 TIGR03279 family radical SAM protein [Acaryochloris sp. 'Moss Beach']
MSKSSIQPALISAVVPDSIAAEVGFEPGDRLVSINGEVPRDLIDYRFFCADEYLTLEVLDAAGRPHQVEIEKDFDSELGLEFETALFDGLIQCNNHCPFCFIDQKPPGLRSSLYLKDDDYRLSFLYGSYLTLTNIPPHEWDRIEAMRLSPLYVSVHATHPDVRIRLLKNLRAGQILDQLQWFQQRRLQIHAQVVVCPGINDGEILQQTILDLAQFHQSEVPAVSSIAVVPVGLTRFRPPEDELKPVEPTDALTVIHQVQQLQTQFQSQFGTTFAWLADEWFLIAGQDLPPESHYGEYPQIDNGVGSIRQFLSQFDRAAESLPSHIPAAKRLTWVVGNTVEQAFQPIVQRLNQVQGLTVTLAPLRSDYWGQTMTVTGLLTGQDILSGLRHQSLGDRLLLPTLMLKYGTTQFLDDMTVAELSDELDVPIGLIQGGAEDVIRACLQQ